jgi:hypothetical protein
MRPAILIFTYSPISSIPTMTSIREQLDIRAQSSATFVPAISLG